MVTLWVREKKIPLPTKGNSPKRLKASEKAKDKFALSGNQSHIPTDLSHTSSAFLSIVLNLGYIKGSSKNYKSKFPLTLPYFPLSPSNNLSKESL